MWGRRGRVILSRGGGVTLWTDPSSSVDRITHISENITFSRTAYGVSSNSKGATSVDNRKLIIMGVVFRLQNE